MRKAVRATMITCLVYGGSIIRVDILLLVKKPISVICAPLRGIEYRICTFPLMDPRAKGAPPMSSLDPRNFLRRNRSA